MMWKDNEPTSDDCLEEPATPTSSSSAWFRFLRSPNKSSSSRWVTVDDDGETLPTSSFEDETEGWIGQVMNNPSAVGDGWKTGTGGLYFPPARSRFPTESTIQTVATEEIEEEDSLSQDLLEGMEQNLAFLNI